MTDKRRVIHILDPERAYHTACGADTREAIVSAVVEAALADFPSFRPCKRCRTVLELRRRPK